MLINNYIFHNTWLVPTSEQIKHMNYQPSTEHGVTVASIFIKVYLDVFKPQLRALQHLASFGIKLVSMKDFNKIQFPTDVKTCVHYLLRKRNLRKKDLTQPLLIYHTSSVMFIFLKRYCTCLTLILLTWKIWWAPNNVSKWQMEFNSAFKGLNFTSISFLIWNKQSKIHLIIAALMLLALMFIILFN